MVESGTPVASSLGGIKVRAHTVIVAHMTITSSHSTTSAIGAAAGPAAGGRGSGARGGGRDRAMTDATFSRLSINAILLCTTSGLVWSVENRRAF